MKKEISMERFAKGPSSSNTTNGASSNNGKEKLDAGEVSSGSDGILKRRRIEKVNSMLRRDRRNKGCYDPEVVSVGPYHHGKEKLQKAENLKPRVAEMLVSYCTSHNMDEFRQKVLEKADDARSCYIDGSTDEYSKEEFAEMMLLDACLVLAFIEAPVYHNRRILNEIATCLGMQALHASGTDVFNLLENQIPFLVLETVMTLKYGGDVWMDVLDMFCERRMIFGVKDYTPNAISRGICEKKPPLHLLEYFWLREHAFYQPNNTLKSWGTAGTSAKQSINKFIYSFRSVSELKSKGIYVKPSDVHSRKAIEFTSSFFYGSLKLRPLLFTPDWIIECSNFVAYELGLNDPDNLLTMAYVNFMKSLINRPDDVKELRSKSILLTTFSSDEQVVEHFNGIITSEAEDFKLYDEVGEQIQMYYHSKWKPWIAELLHNYFTSPWTFVAFLAGTSLLVFTFLQTYFTIYPRRES